MVFFENDPVSGFLFAHLSGGVSHDAEEYFYAISKCVNAKNNMWITWDTRDVCEISIT